MQPQMSAKGFFGSLFDFSFSSLITTKVIKFVYAAVTILVSLAALGVIIAGIASRSFLAVVAIVVVPFVWLLYIVMARIYLEVMIIVFRIGEDIRYLAVQSGPPAGDIQAAPGYQPQPPTGYQPEVTPRPGFAAS
jgi:hypothetical protein